jgi:3-phenylpropionate/trans-cinnamate dioxygenase ferredoxin reductase subunit
MAAQDSEEVDATAPLGAIQPLTVSGDPYALIHHAEGWSLVPDACTHSGCAFTANGEVADGTILICNCHGSEFDLRTGEVVQGPAQEPLLTTTLEVRDGAVQLPAALTESGSVSVAPPSTEESVIRLQADFENCKGFANCVVAADDYLDLDDDGVVVVLQPQVPRHDQSRVEEAVRSCPISALRLETT